MDEQFWKLPQGKAIFPSTLLPAELLGAIIDSSDDAIISKDLDGVITSWNKGAERMFGYSADEAVGHPMLMLVPADRNIEESAIHDRLKRGERIEHHETQRRRRDGTLLDLSLTISPIKDSNGRLMGASIIARDITEQKRFEAANSLLAAIVDSSDDAIISKDLNGVITSWNIGAERLFGWTAPEVVGRPVSVLFPPDRIDEEPRILERLKSGQRVDHFETIRVRKDGVLLHISLTISPVRDRTGRIIGASKIARDVSGRKRIEAEIERYRQHLESIVEERTAELARSHQRLRATERLSSLGTLSAGLGHDIGNVMMPLNAHVQALQAQLGVSAAMMNDHFEAIYKSIEYLQSLANGLRLLSIDPEHSLEIAGQVDVHEWWKQTEPLLKTALSRSIILEHEFAPNLPPLAIPQHLFTQAVFNLVQNAAQAIVSMGPAARAGVQGRVRVAADAASNAADMIRLSVSDNGPGMTSEVRDHCLEPFFTTKTRGISTGLGLAVVHGIIQNVHGALSIDTAPGKGAVFTVTIPAAPSKSTDHANPRKIARVDIQNARLRALVTFELSTLNVASAREPGEIQADPSLLIIDDGPDRRNAAAEFLVRHPGSKVVVVGTEPQVPSSDRVLEIGPIINRDVLRQALQVALT